MLPQDRAAAAAWLEARLAQGPEDGWRAAMPPRHTFDAPCPAAVLIGLVWHDTAPSILLTQRSEHLPTHAGQISFPGGKQAPQDRDAIDTALREAEEEVGLARDRVTVLGTLPRFVTITRFAVTPVVGLMDPPLALRADPGEVAAMFEVPLALALQTERYQRHPYERDGHVGYYLSLTWQDRYIWGATAAMLHLLALTLNAPARG